MRKLIFIFCFLFLVSCGTRNKSLSGKKSRKKELIDKATFRENLRNEGSRSNKNTKTKPVKEHLEATSSLRVTKDMIQDYILRFKSIAQDNMREHGIPASITLAQGVLESGSGQGTLSKKANNHFGIKCHDWTGPSVSHTDDEPNECFRKYKNPEESYRDHSLFLKNRGRYSKLFKLDQADYKGWAKELRRAGYATDPKYPDKLISLIERYELHLYDAEVLGGKYIKIENDLIINTVDVDSEYHKVVFGDTLYSISKRYNTTVEKLIELNNLTGNMISLGQLLKIK